MPEATDQHDAPPLTWHEPPTDLAASPYDRAEVADIVDAWNPQETA